MIAGYRVDCDRIKQLRQYNRARDSSSLLKFKREWKSCLLSPCTFFTPDFSELKKNPIQMKPMVELYRKYITLERFALKHDRPVIFVLSQWQKTPNPTLWYLIIKLLLAATFLVTWILSFVSIQSDDNPGSVNPKWFIYLTNWGYTVCTLQSIFGAVMISSCFLSKSVNDLSCVSKKLYKIYWTINIIAVDVAFGITILYWTLIFDEKIMSVDAMNVVMHGTNSLLMLVDLFLVAHPVRILHFYLPAVFGIAYLIFSVIYYLAGGTSRDGQTSIYPILNWDKPGTTTIICLGVLIFIIVLHCVSYLMYRLRRLIYYRIIGTTLSEQNNEISDNTKPDKGYINETLAIDTV